jgi:hypothetical protein
MEEGFDVIRRTEILKDRSAKARVALAPYRETTESEKPSDLREGLLNLVVDCLHLGDAEGAPWRSEDLTELIRRAMSIYSEEEAHR